jgi:hypothetical protein
MIIAFPDRDSRPVIDITVDYYGERHVITKQIVKLLLATGKVFQHDNRLVRIIRQTDSEGTFSRPERINVIYLRDLVARVARFRKIDGRSGKWVPIDPPKEVISQILGHHVSELPFPRYYGEHDQSWGWRHE